MHICDLTTLWIDGDGGGVNTYLLEKARYLAGRPDTTHTIIVPGKRSEKRLLFGSTVFTIKSKPLPSNPQHRVLTQFAEVKRLLRQQDPDIVEVDCAYMLGQVARGALSRDVPIVGFYHVHLPTFIARPRASRFGSLAASTAERFAWRYVSYCSQYSDRLVVASKDIHERLTQAGFANLEYVSLGVNLDLFQPRRTVEREEPLTILSVGRLSPEKDLATLIQAFKLLRPRERFRLRIVGEGPIGRPLARQAASDPRIELLGSCPYGEELAAIYRSADVLAVPSPNETFNLTVLEGLASGLPVVAIDRGGPKNLVTSEVGELARPGDAEDFARKLEAVSRRQIQPATCRALVEAHYSWERTFDRLLEVYERAREGRAVAT